MAVCLGNFLLTAPVPGQEVKAPEVEREAEVVLPVEAELGTKDITVPLHLVVERDGSVSDVQVVSSKGEILDDAAVRAAKQLRFRPALRDGRPTRARISFEMSFAPHSTESEDSRGSDAPKAATPLRFAAKAEGTTPPEFDEVFVVTGARVPEREAESVTSIQVINREDMRLSGGTTVADVLEAQPGLQLSRTFRGTELWIRGLDPEYTLVLVDGERVPGRVGGALDLSRFPLETIERIEIVRGPSSALYGSDAIGGVVNIITRESEKALEADAEARIATAQAMAGSARIAGRPHEAVGLVLSAGHQHTPSFQMDDTSVATSGSARSLSSVGASVSLGRAKKERVRLSGDYTRTRLEGVDQGAGGAIFDRTQLQEQGLVALNHTAEFGRTYLQNIFQYSQFREQYLNDQRGSTALDSYEDNVEHLGQVTTTMAQRWNDRHRTTLGGEVMVQNLDSERLSDSGFRARYSGFAEHRAVLFQTHAEPSSPREDASIQRGPRQLLTAVPGVRVDIDSQFGNQVSPKFALRYDPAKEWTLRAGYGRGFRAPSFQELLLRFENPAVGYVVQGNPELEAEASHSVDVSVEYRPTAAWFFSAAGYYNVLTDMIATITSDQPSALGTLFTYDNIDSAWTRGVETQAIWSKWKLLTLTGGYTFLQTRDETLDRPLSGRPLHRITARIVSSYEPFGLTFSARGSLSLKRAFFVDEDGDGVDTQIDGEPLTQIDLRLGKTFTESFELFVGVNNLANAGDAYANLLPRQAYAGLRGSF